MSFYRIYRPQVIDEIDNPAIREYLTQLLSKSRDSLPHAYFLTGPKGTGKTTAARVIAKIFNCAKITKSGPCGTCEQCTSIAKGTSMDVVEMDAASNRGIDEIRSLRDRISLSPVSAPFTIYIIDEVHMLTTEAFNALLKTLEEPPPHAVFVLATTDAHKVPDTILSRCVQLGFVRAGITELTHVISRIVKEEHLSIEKDAITLIATASDGSFRDAVKLLEQVSFHKGNITRDVVEKTLHLSDEKVRHAFLSHLATRSAKEALVLISHLVEEGRDMKEFMSDVISDLHGLLLLSAGGASVDKWNVTSLTDCIRRLTAAFGELRYSPISSLPLELVVIEYCARRNETVSPEPSVAQAPVETKSPVVTSKDTAEVALQTPPATPYVSFGLLTLEKLIEHWSDFIAATKPYNHSVAGVLRSSRPKAVDGGIVTIEAFYKFHQEKLATIPTKQILSDVLKKLFGEKVKIEIVLGKK